MDRYGFKLAPTLRLVWASGQQLARLPYTVDNRLHGAVRPSNRPSFADCDRNRPPNEFVHSATVPCGAAKH